MTAPLQGIAPTGLTQRARVCAVLPDGTAACGRPDVKAFPSGVAFDPAHPMACRKCVRALEQRP